MKYHVGCFIANTIRLIEYFVIIFSVIFKLDIGTCFYFLIIIRIFYSLYLYYFYIKEFFFCKLCIFRFSEFKKYINFKEFVDNSLLPISLIFNNQILVIIIKYYFGDNSVILFSTLRTFFRFSNQLTAAINMSLWQEILCYVRAEDWNNHKKIVGKLLVFNGVVLFFVSILYLFIGRDIFDYWTRGSIVVNYFNYILILFSVIFYAMWQPVYIYFNTLAKYNIYSYFYFLIQLMLLFSVCVFSFDAYNDIICVL
jgi:O-antigen/teichoic acid export membrane protein